MSKKRILFITQYFFPENFKGNDIAFHLAKDHEVTVITAVPNYPHGTFYQGYGILRRSKEVINGVRVIRVPVIPRGNGSSIQLMLNYFSYAFVASFYTFYLALTRKFDTVFIQQLSPVILAIPGIIYKKLRRVPTYLWVLDLWPESLQAAGNVKNRFILKTFEHITKCIYSNSSKILISSKGFRKSITSKGIPEEKLIYFPNWAEDVFTSTTKQQNILPLLPKGFKVMFAGNIGEAQDFESIMNAALELKQEKNIKFIIVGDGRKKEWVENFIKEHELIETVFLIGRHPLETMPYFFKWADCMLVTLKSDPIFNLTAPAKIQAYMAAGKPIIGMMNGEGAELINEAVCGKVVPANDYIGLRNTILYISKISSEELLRLGDSGKNFYKENFEKYQCLSKLINVMIPADS